MKKFIKVIIFIILFILVSVGSIYGYKKYLKYENDNKIVTYILNNPIYPLVDLNREEYIVNTVLTEENDLYGKMEVRIENGKVLIDNKITGEVKTISNISNAKYITDLITPFIITSDGKLYCNIIDRGFDYVNYKFEEAKLSGYTDLDGTYFPGDEVNEKFVSIISKTWDGNGKILYAKTESNKYYRLNGNNISLVENIFDEEHYDVVSAGYYYILYNDGRVAYEDPEQQTNNFNPKGYVLDEKGNQLFAYKFIGMMKGQAYFVSNEKKLYKSSFININEDNQLQAELISDSPVYSFSYKASAKDDVIVKFQNGGTYTINDVPYKVAYKLYED